MRDQRNVRRRHPDSRAACSAAPRRGSGPPCEVDECLPSAGRCRAASADETSHRLWLAKVSGARHGFLDVDAELFVEFADQRRFRAVRRAPACRREIPTGRPAPCLPAAARSARGRRHRSGRRRRRGRVSQGYYAVVGRLGHVCGTGTIASPAFPGALSLFGMRASPAASVAGLPECRHGSRVRTRGQFDDIVDRVRSRIVAAGHVNQLRARACVSRHRSGRPRSRYLLWVVTVIGRRTDCHATEALAIVSLGSTGSHFAFHRTAKPRPTS